MGIPHVWTAHTDAGLAKTATSMTMNSPASMKELYDVVTSSKDQKTAVETAEIMREVGLKCIGFNGIPRTINCLGAFRSSLPEDVVRGLATKPTRYLCRHQCNQGLG